MSEHDKIRRTLALAASGDVSPEELRRLQAHLRRCDSCRHESEDLDLLAEALRQIPTPQPRQELILRVRELAESRLAVRREPAGDARVLAALVVVSWVVALATWPVVRLSVTWAMGWMFVPEGGIRTALAAYSALGFLMAFVSAVAVGRRARVTGRTR
jgi:predicted anti-sigma-YlaC factor YlaD